MSELPPEGTENSIFYHTTQTKKLQAPEARFPRPSHKFFVISPCSDASAPELFVQRQGGLRYFGNFRSLRGGRGRGGPPPLFAGAPERPAYAAAISIPPALGRRDTSQKNGGQSALRSPGDIVNPPLAVEPHQADRAFADILRLHCHAHQPGGRVEHQPRHCHQRDSHQPQRQDVD